MRGWKAWKASQHDFPCARARMRGRTRLRTTELYHKGFQAFQAFQFKQGSSKKQMLTSSPNPEALLMGLPNPERPL